MAPEAKPSRVQLLKTSFVIYYHVDLAKARQFYLDFGLTITQETPGKEIFFKGYGSEPFLYCARQAEGPNPYFGGATYAVEHRSELEKAEAVPGATKIATLKAPGGGEIVTLTDPIGHKVHIVYGQQENETEFPKLEKLVINFEDEKPRKGKFQRFSRGPAPVFRWGHYGVTYPPGMYHTMYDWYSQIISLAPSDVVERDGKPVTCFMHIDRGLEFTDHHAFFFKPAKPGMEPAVAHAAFEVHDFDIQNLGHEFLESKGYNLCWGVGRVSLPSLYVPFYL